MHQNVVSNLVKFQHPWYSLTTICDSVPLCAHWMNYNFGVLIIQLLVPLFSSAAESVLGVASPLFNPLSRKPNCDPWTVTI